MTAHLVNADSSKADLLGTIALLKTENQKLRESVHGNVGLPNGSNGTLANGGKKRYSDRLIIHGYNSEESMDSDSSEESIDETSRLRNRVMDLTSALADERRKNMHTMRVHAEQRKSLVVKLKEQRTKVLALHESNQMLQEKSGIALESKVDIDDDFDPKEFGDVGLDDDDDDDESGSGSDGMVGPNRERLGPRPGDVRSVMIGGDSSSSDEDGTGRHKVGRKNGRDDDDDGGIYRRLNLSDTHTKSLTADFSISQKARVAPGLLDASRAISSAGAIEEEREDSVLSDLESADKKKQSRSKKKGKIRKLKVHDDGFEEWVYPELEGDGSSSTETDSGSEIEDLNGLANGFPGGRRDSKREQELRQELLREQMKVEEERHYRKKSEFVAFQAQRELQELRQFREKQENKNFTTKSSKDASKRPSIEMNIHPSSSSSSGGGGGGSRSDGGRESVFRNCAPDCACREFKSRIRVLEETLNKAHGDVEKLDRERRNSLARLSERMFQKMLEAEHENNLNTDSLEKQIQSLTADKIRLIQWTSSEIDSLRGVIRTLTHRLNRYERPTNPNGHGAI